MSEKELLFKRIKIRRKAGGIDYYEKGRTDGVREGYYQGLAAATPSNICHGSTTEDIITHRPRVCIERNSFHREIRISIEFYVQGFENTRRIVHIIPCEYLDNRQQRNMVDTAVKIYRQMNVFYSGMVCLCHIISLLFKETQKSNCDFGYLGEILKEVAFVVGMSSEVAEMALTKIVL